MEERARRAAAAANTSICTSEATSGASEKGVVANGYASEVEKQRAPHIRHGGCCAPASGGHASEAEKRGVSRICA